MNYSFFGTCANDYEQFFGCLNTILNQSILPKEIILVNAGNKDIKKNILDKIKNKNIKLVYIHKKTSRVKSLNLAVDQSTSKYSLRFDSRSRFSKCYSKNALKILNDRDLKVSAVGGVPDIIPNSNKFESILCASIMRRSYIFFYPKHRNKKYCGFASSIYLGCFNTELLKKIRFNEEEALLSEDSLIINDFLKKGYKAYLSPSINLSYVSRSSFVNIIKLFNTYGFCRANTILLSKKLFISSRHFFVFLSIIFTITFLLKLTYISLIFLPIILIF